MMHYSISIYAKNPAPRSPLCTTGLPELGLSTTDKVTFVAWIGEWILRTALSSSFSDGSIVQVVARHMKPNMFFSVV